MRRLPRCRVTALLFAASTLAAEAKDASYAAAQEAQQRGDCAAMVEHLGAFLDENPNLREAHPDFYLQVRVVMGQCSSGFHVSGAGGDSLAIDPLPALPQTEEQPR